MQDFFEWLMAVVLEGRRARIKTHDPITAKGKMHSEPDGHSVLVIRLVGGREAQSKHEGGKQVVGGEKGGAKADSPRELEGLV